MAVLEFLAIFVAFALLVGSIGGLVALFRLAQMERRIAIIERALQNRFDGATDRGRPARTEPASSPRTGPLTPPKAIAQSPAEAISAAKAMDATASPIGPTTRASSSNSKAGSDWLAQLGPQIRDNWMIWLGGLCVALAGIFLAKYSMEKGLLGPTARVSIGILTGIALHIAAEWLRRRTHESHPAFAALAGGGSITLFAALLAALHFYQLINPATAFVLMAIVALATMWSAYWHGPVLAAIGIIGAYLVPMLVSSGEDRVLVALAYTLIISTSGLLLMRYVYRSWLWWGLIVGTLGWWAITILHSDADYFRGLYLAAFGYLMLVVPEFDLLLSKPVRLPEENYRLLTGMTLERPVERQLPLAFLLLVVAQGISIAVEAHYSGQFLVWTPLVLLLLLAARCREQLAPMPWLLLIAQGIGWCSSRLLFRHDHFEFRLLDSSSDNQFLWYLAGTAIVFVGLALRNLAACRFKALWSSLATLAPLLLMALGYMLTSRQVVSWYWGSSTLLVSLAYFALATAALRKSSIDALVVWLFFGAHFALSLAAVMLLSEASLTLAIAVQVISTAWIIRHFQLPQLGWLVKLLVGIVVVRLTLNPWLIGYPADVHWSLWTYGGATLCGVAGAYMLRLHPSIARWAEGAALHLFVLTLWAETRYWLHDGSVFAGKFTFLESAIYVSLFGTMSIVYFRRSLVSETLEKLYLLYSHVLLSLAVLLYGWNLGATLVSDSWVWHSVGSTPVFNLTLLAFGAPVLIGVLAWRYHMPRLRQPAAIFAGIALLIYVSLQIRHLWQGTIRLDVSASDGELYTYSAVWLIMAIVAILGGAWRLGQPCYRAGMLLLAIVIAKLFVVDMSGLEGLLRVASFMGLGIGLLGISYLHQRLQALTTK